MTTEKNALLRLDQDGLIRMPGIGTAHSHAFQRALRGRTQRSSSQGSFWSWRALMYEYASTLDPDGMYDTARSAYEELYAHGVRAVGEFHYLHHQPDGTPYDNRTEMADAVIRAALDSKLRISLLRVIYQRGGYEQLLDSVQERFSDSKLGDALVDVEALIHRYSDNSRVAVGIAPHSVRAVSREWISEAHAFSHKHDLPFHMHVAEQQREIDECLTEHGKRPVELLASLGVLDRRFVAVHATHLTADESRLLGEAKSFACICRTTERDLGDGLPNIAALRDAGARFCTGTDSHAWSCPFEEARAIELDERSRTQSRHAGLGASSLIDALTTEAYASIGLSTDECLADEIRVDPNDLAMRGSDMEQLCEAVVYGASRSAVLP